MTNFLTAAQARIQTMNNEQYVFESLFQEEIMNNIEDACTSGQWSVEINMFRFPEHKVNRFITELKNLGYEVDYCDNTRNPTLFTLHEGNEKYLYISWEDVVKESDFNQNEKDLYDGVDSSEKQFPDYHNPRVAAIKAYRVRTGANLETAKDAADRYQASKGE